MAHAPPGPATAAMPTTTTSRNLRTEALGLRVLQDGSGPDLLLIAGLGDGSAVWDQQVAGLARDFRLTRYDARGTAGAPTPPGPYAQSSLVDDALEVMDAAGIARAHVVGSSLGGVIAQRLAISHPERVASITLCATWARPDRALRALYSSWRWAAERSSSLGDLLALVYSTTCAASAWNSGDVDRRIIDAEVRELASPRARDAFIWTTSAALERAPAGELSALRVPALIVAGGRDRVLDPRHADELRALLPGSRIELLAEAGHRPAEEQPALFNELLSSFLAPICRRDAIAV